MRAKFFLIVGLFGFTGGFAGASPRSDLCRLLLTAQNTPRGVRGYYGQTDTLENWADTIAECRARPSGAACEDLVVRFERKIFASARIFMNIYGPLVGSRLTHEDLVQAGITGLLSEIHNPAVDWRNMPGPKQTIALARSVLRGIHHEIAHNLTHFRIAGHTDVTRLKAIGDLIMSQWHGNDLDLAAIAVKRRLSEGTVRRFLDVIRWHRVSMPVTNVPDDTVHDDLDSELYVDGRTQIAESDDQRESERLVRIVTERIVPRLKPRWRYVFERTIASDEMTLTEIGRDLGISAERVRQIRERVREVIEAELRSGA